MAAKPKLTPAEWTQARATWESDQRDGYTWLIEELDLPLTRAALRKVAIREEWAKKSADTNPTVAKNEIVESKVSKVSKKPAKEPSDNQAKPSAHRVNKGSGDKVSGSNMPKVSGEVMVSKVSEAVDTKGGDQSAEESKKNPIGRPTLYKEDYAKQAYRLCLLGAIDEELAEFFEVSVSTITSWKSQHPDFLASIKSGKVEADSKVVERLYERAMGYSHPDVHVSNHKGDITLTPITKHYPPDVVAAIFLLKNRHPEKWRDKVEVGVNVKLDKEQLTEIEQVFMEKMARSRERQEAIQLERGITIEHGQD